MEAIKLMVMLAISVITESDAKLTAEIAVGLVQPSYVQTIVCDVNCDGQITTFDAALIQQYATGVEPTHQSMVGEKVIINGTTYIYGDADLSGAKKNKSEQLEL